MSIQDYINNKKQMQNEILHLVSDDQAADKLDLKKLKIYINNQKIREDANEFRSFLYLIVNIADNHHRSPEFFNIIGQILLIVKDEFSNNLTENEIFNIFYKNNQILLFLIENKIFTVNNYFAETIKNGETLTNYFINEIKPFLKDDFIAKKVKENEKIEPDPEIFKKNLQIGENEKIFCKLIREDDLKNFIIYTNQTNLSLKIKLQQSIFETNSYLYEYEPTLIEYAAFFGSFQIFNYLRLKGIELTSTLWICAVHGRNAQMIHLLEENQIEPPDNSYESVFIEAIICHHNELAHYFDNNYLNNERNDLIYSKAINSYNYEYYPDDFNNQNSFINLCNSDQFYLVEQILLTNENFNTNFKKHISLYFDEVFSTPFYLAIQNDHTNICELLSGRPETDVNSIASQFRFDLFDMTTNCLIQAIWRQNIKIVKLLLSHEKIDVNRNSLEKEITVSGSLMIKEYVPLVQAVKFGGFDIVKILLSHNKIDPNLYETYYDTADNANYISKTVSLYDAIKNENIEIIKLLLGHPKINVNAICSIKIIKNDSENEEEEQENNSVVKVYNETPLCYTIRKIKTHKKEIVQLLLDNSNININIESSLNSLLKNKKRTALHIAIEKKDKEMVRMLLERPEIDLNIKYDFTKSLNLHFKLTPLQTAIYYGDIEMITLLLSYEQIDVNQKGIFYENGEKRTCSALDFAIYFQKKEIVQILLKHPKIIVNDISFIVEGKDGKETRSEFTPFQNAVFYSSEDIVALLLSYDKINVNQSGFFCGNGSKVEYDALTSSVLAGDLKITEILLSSPRIDINKFITINNISVYTYKLNVLHFAIFNNKGEVLPLLISQPNLDINCKSLYNNEDLTKIIETTALHFAFENKKDEYIMILLSSPRVDVNVNSKFRITTDTSFKEKEKSTLEYAIKNGNIEIIKLLLNKPEIDLNQKSKTYKFCSKKFIEKEKTPLQIAVKHKNHEIIQLLLKFYAENNKLSDDCIDELIKLTNDDEIKSLINQFKKT